MRNASTPRGSAKASKKARTPFSDQKNIKSASPKQKGARAAKKSAARAARPPSTSPRRPASPDRDFSKAEALAAAAAHVCSLRHQSDHPLLSGGGGSSGPTGVDGRGGAWHEVSFAAGPLGIEFEPEGVARGSGVETGCMVVRVHELASHPAQMVARRGVCAGSMRQRRVAPIEVEAAASARCAVAVPTSWCVKRLCCSPPGGTRHTWRGKGARPRG